MICPECKQEFDCENQCLEKCIAKIHSSKEIDWNKYRLDYI